jgi:hypothetical protein
MTTKTFRSDITGSLVFDLEAAAAIVRITVSPDATTATAELSGPAEIVDGARATSSAGRWVLTLPCPRPIITGNATVINHGGGTIIVGDVMTVTGLSIGGGRVQVGSIRGVSGIAVGGTEPVRLTVTLPAGSRLTASIDAGQLTVRGELPDAEINGTAVDVEVGVVARLAVRTISGDITADAVTGSAGLHTVSGDVRVRATSGPVTASTTSGDIAIDTASSVVIDARSVSGDITVQALGLNGAMPDVRARSVSGDVRTFAR